MRQSFLEYKDLIQGRDIKPYCSKPSGKHLLFIPWHFPLNNSEDINGVSKEAETLFQSDYPNIYSHLLKYKIKLNKRNKVETGIRYEWYAMQRWASDYWEEFDKPKIMYQVMQVKPCFIYDESGLYCNNSIWFIPSEDKVLLGILNSKIGWWLISKYCTAIQNGYQLIWKYFSKIPIINSNDNSSKEIQSLVEQILELKENDSDYNTSDLENRIDKLVFKM